MKLFINNEHIIEIILSWFRWVFLIIAGAYYYLYLHGSSLAFFVLLLFGLAYMTVAEIVLHKTPIQSKQYRYMTKVSVVFDYVAFLWLVSLTGGAESSLFPVAYLIILHAAVYWKFIGGIIASVLLGTGYTGILLFEGYSFRGEELLSYLLDFMFLIFMGILGGIIASRERTMRSKNTKLEDIARRDFLTDLYNHRSFQEDLLKFSNKDKPLMVVLADIDYFKSVNDRFGHLTGDHVLREIGREVKGQLAGIGKGYRYGGEEIALLIDATDLDAAKKCLMNVRSSIKELSFIDGDESFSVTMSFGIALFPLESDIDRCLRIADERLYCAKHNGRDQIYWSDQYQEESHVR